MSISKESKPRVLFIHGLESSPQGIKAIYLAQHFDAFTPAMNTSDFEGCVELQEGYIKKFKPDVVVGSSFGGAVALALLQKGAWVGPTLLLAQAGYSYGYRELPSRVPILLIHGTRDSVIDINDSRSLAKTGSPELVSLMEVDDEHRLVSIVEDDILKQFILDIYNTSKER